MRFVEVLPATLHRAWIFLVNVAWLAIATSRRRCRDTQMAYAMGQIAKALALPLGRVFTVSSGLAALAVATVPLLERVQRAQAR